MKAIKDIIKSMDNTLDEAHEYYSMYNLYKDESPKIASTALEMAKVHLDLYNKWHAVVVSVINEYRQKSKEPPAAMLAIWNYEHEKLTDEYNKLKLAISSIA